MHSLRKMSKLVFRFLRFSLTLPEQSDPLGMHATTANAVALAPLYFRKTTPCNFLLHSNLKLILNSKS